MKNQEVFFKDIRNKIIESIFEAKTEILIAVAWFTDMKIINSLEKKQQEGVSIYIIFYDNYNNDEKIFSNLIKNGAQVKKSSTLMHNKFCVIDRNIILNGSYNWTINAIKNNENIQRIYNNSDISYEYYVEFFRIFKKGSSTDVIINNDKDELNEFIIKNNFINSYPYFYKIINVKNSNKCFYILIRSIDDIKYIIKYIINIKLFPQNAGQLQSIWNGSYSKKGLYTYDFIDFDNIESYASQIIFPFENNKCLVQISNNIFYIDKSGDIIGSNDYYTYKEGDKYFIEGIKNYNINDKIYKVESTFFTNKTIGNRITILSKILNKNKYYGAINEKNSLNIPISYDTYEIKNDNIIFYSYPKLTLIEQKKRGEDYFKVVNNKIESEKKSVIFNQFNESLENQKHITLNELSSFDSLERIYLSDINDATILNVITYILNNKSQIKSVTFFAIFQTIKNNNLVFNYDARLFEFINAIISSEKQLIYSIYGVY